MSDADLDPFEGARAGASLVVVVVVGTPLRHPRRRALPPPVAFLAGLQRRMSMIGDGGLKSCREGRGGEGEKVLSLSLFSQI